MGKLLTRKRGRILVAAGALTALTIGGAYAFTAANTVTASKAGDGAAAVSGFAVSNIHYGLNTTTPSNVDSVNFVTDTAAPTGSTLKAQFTAGGNWYTCTNANTAVACDTTSPALTVLPTDTVRVVIAQ